jgi:sn-glycerol 3-phosphate transport system substrate-binding protein
MKLHRTARGALGTAIVVSSLAAVTLITPLTVTAASAATNCSPSALPGSGKVNITYWEGMTAANETLMQKLVSNFNASQNKIHVTDVNQSGGYVQTWDNYLAALKTNSAPNVVMLDQYISQGAVDSKSIIPIATCVAGTHYSTAKFAKKAIAQQTLNHALQGMPFSVSAPILIYNKLAFAAAHISKPPTTVAQMAADAKLLKNKSYHSTATNKTYKLVDGMTIKLDPWWLQVWQGTGGSYFVNNQNGRTGRATGAAFNNAIGKAVFSQIQGIVKSGNAVTNPSTGAQTVAYSNLYEIGYGKSGMTIDSSGTLGTILSYLPIFKNVKIGVAPMPKISSSASGGVQPGGNALYMPSSSNNTAAEQAASWSFIQYLTNATNMATWDAGTGYVPIRSDAAAAPAMVKFWKTWPTFKTAYTEIQTGVVNNATAGPLVGNYYTVINDIANSENTLLGGGFPNPNTVLTNASNQVTSDILNYNSKL